MTNLDYLYNKDAASDIFGKNHFVDNKLHFKIIERGTILPHKNIYVNGGWTWGFGGIVNSRNEFVENSYVHKGAGGAYTPTEEIFHSPATVVYLGLFYPVWGHCITDNIRRLWFLKSDIFKTYFKNCQLIYIPWAGQFSFEYMQNFKRLLEILEVDINKLVPVYHPAQFENIILPDDSFYDGKFTNEYRETIEQIKSFALKNQTPTSSKKVYFYYGTAQFGEKHLAEYFHSKGYEIFSPEKLTFDEQLNLMINAESFASTLGSCSHNSIFLRDGTECIFIPRAAKRFSGYQQMIDQIANLNAIYIDSTLSIFETMNGPYCFIISEQLKKFFGDEFTGYDEEDFKAFVEYSKSSTQNGYQRNEEAWKYYEPVLQKFFTQLSQRKDLMEAYKVKFA